MDAENRASALPSPAPVSLDQPTATLSRPQPEPGPGSPAARVTLRFMDAEHLPFVVAEQRRHFPDGFFSRLGPAFLTAHTRTYLTSPHATALIAEADGRPVGYLTGIVDPGLHRRHLLRLHGLSLAARAAGALALRPSLAWLFLSSRLPRYWHKLVPARRRAAAPAGERPVAAEAALDRTSDAPAEREAVLSHIAVTEDARGLGVGAELIERFADFAVLADCTRISLLTAAGAGGAGPYYERLGWRPRGDTRTADDRHFLQYERPLPHFTMP